MRWGKDYLDLATLFPVSRHHTRAGLVAVEGQAADGEDDVHPYESHGRCQQEAKVPFREMQKTNHLKRLTSPGVHLRRSAKSG
jgi:hypothetical protein